MCIPTAQNMAKNLNYLLNRLYESQIIDANRIGGFCDAVTDLKNQGERKNWAYRIEKSKPLTFKSISNSKIKKRIYPRIYIDIGVEHRASNHNFFPFKRLIITIEILYEDNNQLISRYHIDLADIKNGKYQSAPLFHLQFGGGNSPETDTFKLKQPRWLHPPMDLILMTEVVIANFYPDQWKKLRFQTGWVKLVIESQKLCYGRFLKLAKDKIGTDSLISTFWAVNWNN